MSLIQAGEITRAQADRIRAEPARSGRVLGGHGPRGHRGRGGPRGAMRQELAKALGISEQKLHDELHAGRSIADVKAVAEGDLTRAQAVERLEHLEAHLARLDQARGGFRGRRGP